MVRFLFRLVPIFLMFMMVYPAWAMHYASVLHGQQGISHGSPQLTAEGVASQLGVQSEEERCSICLDDFCENMVLIYLECDHVYHLDCILGLVESMPPSRTNRMCPQCRKPIEVYNQRSGERHYYGIHRDLSDEEDNKLIRLMHNQNVKVSIRPYSYRPVVVPEHVGHSAAGMLHRDAVNEHPTISPVGDEMYVAETEELALQEALYQDILAGSTSSNLAEPSQHILSLSEDAISVENERRVFEVERSTLERERRALAAERRMLEERRRVIAAESREVEGQREHARRETTRIAEVSDACQRRTNQLIDTYRGDLNKCLLDVCNSSGDDVDVARRLLELGANKEAQDSYGNRPLHRATISDKIGLVKCLLEVGAHITACNQFDFTSLHEASLCGSVTAAKYLLDNGAYKDARDKNGRTPLHLASMQGHIAVVECLVECRANIELRDKEGKMALHHASRGRHVEVMKYLDRQGSNIEARDEEGRTPLLWAVWNNCYEGVRYLVERGANKQTRDNSGWTPVSRTSYYVDQGHSPAIRNYLQDVISTDAMINRSSGVKFFL